MYKIAIPYKNLLAPQEAQYATHEIKHAHIIWRYTDGLFTIWILGVVSLSKNYHVEQVDTAHMQQGQYAQDHFKYVEFGDEPDLTQGRKIIQSQTEVEHHIDHIRYPIRASQLQPGGQAFQAVPSRLQQRSRLKKLEVVKRNTTLLSRERVSMAIMKLSEQLFQLRGFPVAANDDLVTGRHFPPWKISSEVASHLEALQRVMNETELSRRNWTHYSLNKDIGARSKV